jgi:hypothetical protein
VARQAPAVKRGQMRTGNRPHGRLARGAAPRTPAAGFGPHLAPVSGRAAKPGRKPSHPGLLYFSPLRSGRQLPRSVDNFGPATNHTLARRRPLRHPTVRGPRCRPTDPTTAPDRDLRPDASEELRQRRRPQLVTASPTLAATPQLVTASPTLAATPQPVTARPAPAVTPRASRSAGVAPASRPGPPALRRAGAELEAMAGGAGADHDAAHPVQDEVLVRAVVVEEPSGSDWPMPAFTLGPAGRADGETAPPAAEPSPARSSPIQLDPARSSSIQPDPARSSPIQPDPARFSRSGASAAVRHTRHRTPR